jgi:hypothetical protein
MKKYLLMLLVAAGMLQQCTDDGEPASSEKGNLRFAFSFLSDDENGRVQATDFPDGSYALLTVTTDAGVPVYENQSVALIRIGDDYTTMPLDFSRGYYRITDFMILSPTNVALYVAPKTGSPLARLVSQPIPRRFRVNNNSVTNVNIEVVAADAHVPADFGYATFGSVVVETADFQIAVLAPNDAGDLAFTTANASIIHDGTIISIQDTPARVSPIYFDEEPGETYTLRILKEGFATYDKVFVLEDLLSDLDGSPLSIVLTPAFTFQPATEDFDFEIEAGGTGTLEINWGDGTVETITLPVMDHFSHLYTSAGPHYVSVTGDLNRIVRTEFFYANGDINALSLIHLPNLVVFRSGLNHMPATVDLSRNLNLEHFEVMSMDFSSLDISHNTHLNFLYLFAPSFTSAAIDDVIDDLYTNVTTYGVYGGEFSAPTDWSDGPPIIGPPSPESIDKLRSIRDDYGWLVWQELP